ncbi:hypothetical protein ACP4OV_027040 [Aristida adscensionis]
MSAVSEDGVSPASAAEVVDPERGGGGPDGEQRDEGQLEEEEDGYGFDGAGLGGGGVAREEPVSTTNHD